MKTKTKITIIVLSIIFWIVGVMSIFSLSGGIGRTADESIEVIAPLSGEIDLCTLDYIECENIINNAIVYAYTSSERETDSTPFITASGYNLRNKTHGVVANNCLDFGTSVSIMGNIYIVEDRMNSRYGCDVFDIHMESLEEALKFGKKTLDVTINE